MKNKFQSSWIAIEKEFDSMENLLEYQDRCSDIIGDIDEIITTKHFDLRHLYPLFDIQMLQKILQHLKRFHHIKSNKTK